MLYWGNALLGQCFIGVSMIAKARRRAEFDVFQRHALTIGVIAGLATAIVPSLARAQVNIDQGKSPAEIYSNDCATCHKTPRGLAVGKSSSSLSGFLREHYTASPEQASALAAYVLGAGGREPAPKQKPEVEHARAEEPKTQQARGEVPRVAVPQVAEPGIAEPRVAEPITATQKPPEEEQAKHEERPGPTNAGEGGNRPAAAAPEAASVAATPDTNKTPSNAATPSPAETSNFAVPNIELGSTTAAVPPEQQPNAGPAVPRDNIPD